VKVKGAKREEKRKKSLQTADSGPAINANTQTCHSHRLLVPAVFFKEENK
jgi:hypothetical protein